MNASANPSSMPNDLLGSATLLEVKSCLLQDLLRGLEAITFLQIATIYLHDNITPFLLLRAIVHISFVTARPDKNPQLIPVILTSLLFFSIHVFAATPHIEGASHGYLHGGILADFVGELPASRWRMMLLDILLLSLQMIQLAINFELLKMKGTVARQDSEADLESGIHRSQDDHPNEGRMEAAVAGKHELDVYYTGEHCISLDVIAALQSLAKSPPSVSPATTDDTAGVIGSLLARMAA